MRLTPLKFSNEKEHLSVLFFQRVEKVFSPR